MLPSWDRIQNHVSFHAVYNHSILEALKYASQSGFKGIQIAVEVPHLSFERLSDIDCLEIRKYAHDHGLYITLHAPDDVTSLFVINPALQRGILEYYSELFDFAEKIQARLITFHLGKITTFPTDTLPKLLYPNQDLPIYRETLEENLHKVIELANNRFILCIENYYFTPMILGVLEPFFQAETLWLCWDIAKTFTRDGTKKPEIETYFLKYLHHIKQIHLHDIKNRRSHRAIGEGLLDIPYFLNLLKNIEVEDYCIEVRPHARALDSYNFLRENLWEKK